MKRIMIIGPGNAGKSTLAIKLGKSLNLPVYHLDKIFWLPNWVTIDREKFIEEQSKITLMDQWIIEGDFKKTYEIRAKRADTIIYLNLPRRVIIPRFFKRVYKYRKQIRPDMTEGNKEKINLDYIKWQYSYDRNSPMDLVKKYKNSKEVYVLSNKKEINNFFGNIFQK